MTETTLDRGIPGCVLAAVAARDIAAAEKRLAGLAHPVPVTDIAGLEPLADIVVECAPAVASARDRRALPARRQDRDRAQRRAILTP